MVVEFFHRRALQVAAFVVSEQIVAELAEQGVVVVANSGTVVVLASSPF